MSTDKKLITFEQMQLQTQRLKSALDTKSDEAEMKNYIRTINRAEDGLEFSDGNGTLIYKLPANVQTIEDFDAYLSAIFELEDYLDGIFYNGETQALSDNEVAAYIDAIWEGNLIIPNPS